MNAGIDEPPESAVSPDTASRRRFPAAGNVLFAGTLLFLASSRWGSYLHVPRIPVYIGDVIVTTATVLLVVAFRQSIPSAVARLRSAPVVVRLMVAFFIWVLARTVTRTALPMVAVRDFAPYAYAVCVLVAFLSPVRTSPTVRRWIYAATACHAIWYAVVTVNLLNPAHTWRVGSGATLFSTRPDFDSVVFGVAIAFALHEMAYGVRPKTPLLRTAMAFFLALNVALLAHQHSRAGLLAAVVVFAATVVGWQRHDRPTRTGVARRAAAGTALLVAATIALMFSVPGQRLIKGFDDTKGTTAAGTSHAREAVINGLTDWLLEDPVRTTFGVGYGPNILARSRTVGYLEGTEFTGVRSPHNYLLGTWARLGLVGALLAIAILIAAGRLSLRQLRRYGGFADTLAALLVLAIPVVALFGVILESPFGAIPYFWAVGQLAAAHTRNQAQSSDASDAAAPVERVSAGS